MADPAPASRAPADSASRAGAPPLRRRDVQALRALAVLLVVVDHFWPSRLLPGGYVGVDVFFVISGYLITGHLLRELRGTGTVDLKAFLGRRARRLLPAAALVTLVATVLARAALPREDWTRTAVEGVGAALYAQNWLMALSTIPELSPDGLPTPFQHFWSLSVEEQFYLAWPVLLLLAVRGELRRGAADGGRRRVLVLVAAATALSFVVGVVHTELSSQTAYFATWTRAWEFGVGALVALGVGVPRRAVTARVLVVLGWAVLAACGVLFHGVAFPGVGALAPVLAAAAIIAGGEAVPRTGLEVLTDRRPVQWLGNASYSVYLWHWPLFLVLPFLLGRTPSDADLVLLSAGVLVLAGATYRWVELPGTRWRWARAAPGRTVAVAAGITAVSLATSLGLGFAAGWTPPAD
ncbi:acyltransferase family protein [Kocuria sp. M1R5S2]|uniref:acyltransferase family protein n=1 Tax=Kocuria rhizosphaerae TaxID=3376285 RepID=UPI0037954A1A